MNNIAIQDILRFSDSLKNEDPEHTYHKAYYYFVKYFSDKDILTEQDLVIGANFAYGWMPTIMNFKSNDFEKALDILNKARGSERISSDEILILKSLINNSLVGVSKLLHFVNPEIYAIWDSRVCHFLLGKSHKYIVEKIELYWDYLDLCQRIAVSEDLKQIHVLFESSIQYKVSKFRVVEQLIFINSSTTISKY